MSSITFSCPDCSQSIRSEFGDESVTVTCDACGSERQLLTPETEDGYLRHCLACPSTELFVRKDFPQRVGVTIVLIGFVISSVCWALPYDYRFVCSAVCIGLD